MGLGKLDQFFVFLNIFQFEFVIIEEEVGVDRSEVASLWDCVACGTSDGEHEAFGIARDKLCMWCCIFVFHDCLGKVNLIVVT